MKGGPPFRTFAWSILGTINAAVITPYWASIGWWWLIPPMVFLIALGWYFSVCSAWYAGQAQVYQQYLKKWNSWLYPEAAQAADSQEVKP